MQAPEHDHLMFLARWSTEIIMGLVTVLLVVVRFIGKSTRSNVPYVTREELHVCQTSLLREFKEMRTELTGKIDHSHDQINRDVNTAHARIDELYKRTGS